MPGTSETAYWEQDGMYLTQTAYGSVTLGTVVELGTTAGTVLTAASASTVSIGVAIAGYRASRTSTDNVVASGGLVNVATRGVVNLAVANGTVTRGEPVIVYGSAGGVATGTTNNVTTFLGIALTTGTQTVKVKLTRG